MSKSKHSNQRPLKPCLFSLFGGVLRPGLADVDCHVQSQIYKDGFGGLCTDFFLSGGPIVGRNVLSKPTNPSNNIPF